MVIKKISLAVSVPRLDPKVFQRNQNSPKVKNSPKTETECMFTSEIDLNEAEHYQILPERTIKCTCGCCSPYYEYKKRLQEERLNLMQEENFNFNPAMCNQNQYTPIPAEMYFLPPPPESCFPTKTMSVSMETQTDLITYKYICAECSSEFNNRFYYEHHRRIHYESLMECPYCNATFFSKKQFQSHVLKHMYKNYYECIYCSVAYSEKKYLIRHLKAHEKISHGCEKCSAQFDTTKLLNEHKKSHQSSGQLIHVFRKLKSTEILNEELPAVQVVETMETPVVNVRPRNRFFFECGKCDVKFENVKQMNKHNAIHKRKGRKYSFVCSYCQGRFEKDNHMKAHQRLAHKK